MASGGRGGGGNVSGVGVDGSCCVCGAANVGKGLLVGMKICDSIFLRWTSRSDACSLAMVRLICSCPALSCSIRCCKVARSRAIVWSCSDTSDGVVTGADTIASEAVWAAVEDCCAASPSAAGTAGPPACAANAGPIGGLASPDCADDSVGCGDKLGTIS